MKNNIQEEEGVKEEMQTSKKEIRENEYLLHGEESLLDKRFAACLIWYIRNACKYRAGYYICTLASVIFPIVVATLNSFFCENPADMRGLTAALSTVASIAVVILTTFRFQEKWTKYRSAAEFLKRARMKYLLAKGGTDSVDSKIDEEFLQTIEKYMEAENEDWQRANLSDTDGVEATNRKSPQKNSKKEKCRPKTQKKK